MLVVLPFENLGPPEDDYFADGITEEIASRLAQLSGLGVIARTSAMHYKGARKSIRQIGQELGVTYVIEGSVRWEKRPAEPSLVRVNPQLIRVADETHVWAQPYDAVLADVFRVQGDIAGRVAEALKVTLLSTESTAVAHRPTDDLAAYTAYLKGRYAWNTRNELGLFHAVDFFRQAIARDSTYALAYAGLADAYIILGNFRLLAPRDAYPAAQAAARRALEIDPTLAQAQISQAFVKFLFEWDWSGAEAEFRQALARAPQYAPGHQWYGVYLAAMGRREAGAELRRAGELEPMSLTINAVAGWIAYLGRRYDEALAHCRRTVDLAPTFPLAHRYLTWIDGVAGRYADALAEAQRALELDSAPALLANLAWASAIAGRRGDAHQLLDRLAATSRRRYVSPLDIAEVHVALGERDEAFAWLERAIRVRDPWLVMLEVEPKLDPLRADPRFTARAPHAVSGVSGKLAAGPSTGFARSERYHQGPEQGLDHHSLAPILAETPRWRADPVTMRKALAARIRLEA